MLGMLPVRDMLLTSKYVRYVSSPISESIVPVMWLPPRDKYRRFIKSINGLGIDPFKLLSFILSNVSAGRFPKTEGIVPDKEVSVTSACTKAVIRPIVVGIVPDSLVYDRARYCSLSKLPIEEGIVPLIREEDISK